MRSVARVALLASVALLAASLSALAQDDVYTVKRYLMAVGANDGGSDRVQLRYATTDARAVAEVFAELGGVEGENRVVLYDPDRATFENSLQGLAARMEKNRPRQGRVELFVYYSGHSDERGLLLGDERLSYTELRDAVDALPADVHVVILDSCASGALTRLKGGERQAPFLVDASNQMEGHAFLTSSSADEAAQESDRIEASFFTSALVSGLRGAADATQDSRVTLNEAYQFAFDETLARTEGTQSGPQHPAYDIQLVGAGDLVMTDLRGTSAGLLLSADMGGRLHVRDANNALVVALDKSPGRSVELGLEPGDYQVLLDSQGSYYGGYLTLTDAGQTSLSMGQLSEIDPELAVARGGPWPTIPPGEVPFAEASFAVSLLPSMSTNGPAAEETINKISLNATVGHNGGVRGAEAAFIGNIIVRDVEGLQWAYIFNDVGRNLEGIQASGIYNNVGGYVHGIQFSGILNNAKGEVRGIQGAGIANIATGKFTGIQAAGVYNHAPELHGLQAAVVNYARYSEGWQVGVVNAAGTVKGSMIGVVNVADDVEGPTIGLVNLVKKGYHTIGMWTSDTAEGTVGLKLGSRYFYTLYSFGTEALGSDERLYAGLGIGGHIPAGPAFVDIELIGQAIIEDRKWPDKVHMLNQGRIGLGLRVLPFMSVIAGGTVNVYVSEVNDGAGIVPTNTWHSSAKPDDNPTWVDVWPGFYLGIQL